jgi:hypothetical protein
MVAQFEWLNITRKQKVKTKIYTLLSFCFITGKQTCYSGWKEEYTGFLMTEHKGRSSKEYACMDKDAEPVDNDTSNKDGALFYLVRTTCGSLRCPPYKNHTEMYCVVCTI